MDIIEIKEEVLEEVIEEIPVADFDEVSPLTFPQYNKDGDAEMHHVEMADFEEGSPDICHPMDMQPSVDPLEIEESQPMTREKTAESVSLQTSPAVLESTSVDEEPCPVSSELNEPPQRQTKRPTRKCVEATKSDGLKSSPYVLPSTSSDEELPLPSDELSESDDSQTLTTEKSVRTKVKNITTNTENKLIKGKRILYRCKHCGKLYVCPIRLNAHYQKVNYCNICDLQLYDHATFYLHIVDIHTTIEFCKICSIVFKSHNPQERYQHAINHAIYNINKYLLKKDNPDIIQNGQVGNIMKVNFPEYVKAADIVINEYRHICKVCNIEVDPNYVHICKAHICNKCHIGFNKEELLVKHIKNKHFGIPTLQSCEKCLLSLGKLSTDSEIVAHLKNCIENEEILRFEAQTISTEQWELANNNTLGKIQIEAQTISTEQWELANNNIPEEIPVIVLEEETPKKQKKPKRCKVVMKDNNEKDEILLKFESDNNTPEEIPVIVLEEEIPKKETKPKRHNVVKKRRNKLLENLPKFETVVFDEYDRLVDESKVLDTNNYDQSIEAVIEGNISPSIKKSSRKCKKCRIEFKDMTQLKDHQSFYHVKCDHCNKKILNFNHLITHYLKIKGVECKICKKVFESFPLRNRHMKSHLRRFKEKCDKCLEIVPMLTHLGKHSITKCRDICLKKGIPFS